MYVYAINVTKKCVQFTRSERKTDFFFLLSGVVEVSVHSRKICQVKRDTEIQIKSCGLTGSHTGTGKTLQLIDIVTKLKVILHIGSLGYIPGFSVILLKQIMITVLILRYILTYTFIYSTYVSKYLNYHNSGINCKYI